jgi:AraC family L-rhamnose operon regulatory protein RhaS
MNMPNRIACQRAIAAGSAFGQSGAGLVSAAGRSSLLSNATPINSAVFCARFIARMLLELFPKGLQSCSAKNIEHGVSHRLTPIYRSRRARYEIDRCIPQTRAVREGKIRLHALTKGHYPGTRIPADVLPSLNSIGFWDIATAQDWGLEPHRNEGIEIAYLETGSLTFTVEQRTFELRPGNFTITRPWQLHKLGAPNLGPNRLHWLILDVGVRRPNQNWRWPRWLLLTPADRAELTRKLRHNEKAVWKATAEISTAFQRLAEGVRRWQQPHAVSRMITHLNQLFLGILEALSLQQTEEDPELTSRRRTVELFLHDLAANPASCSEPWTLPRMAAQCGMGVTAFSKYCRELVNLGPVEYLNDCRLAHAARRILERKETPITTVAFEHGFNSSQYFATAFRRRYHCTPREYRLAAEK